MSSPIKLPFRVLISVSDKTGLIPFAERLYALGATLVSTSGTAKAIKAAGMECTLVEEITGFPEMLNGRVRTLHPMIFGGIIADQQDPDHLKTIAEHGIGLFHMVVISLYPFELTPSIENIDVGGPAMIRAAAKNYRSQIVVTDTRDYDKIAKALEETGDVDMDTRLELAHETFQLTARYDSKIEQYLGDCITASREPEQGKKH